MLNHPHENLKTLIDMAEIKRNLCEIQNEIHLEQEKLKADIPFPEQVKILKRIQKLLDERKGVNNG